MTENAKRKYSDTLSEGELCGMPISVLDRAFDLYGTLDSASAITELRGRIFAHANSDPQQLLGQPFSDTVFWQSSRSNSHLMENAVERATAGEQCSVRLDFRLDASNQTPVDISFTPFFENGSVAKIFVFGRTINQPSEVIDEDTQRLLILAADLGDIGLWYWDNHSEVITSTQKCNELLGLAQDFELTYETFESAVHPEDREAVAAFFDETRERGGRYHEEFRVIYSDGSVEWISAIGRSFVSAQGEPEQMVGVIRRITDEVQSTEELAQVYELEKKAKNEAEIANRSKDLFLTFVSHELRSPLNAILGWAKILNSRDDLTEETVERAHQIIERSAQMQTKIINDLLDSARVTSGKIKLEFRPINLVDVVRSAFESQRPAADQVDLDYSLSNSEPRVVVFGDSNRLQQVFNNLISNALKFTDPGGTVNISILSEASSVNVAITDTGQGIDPLHLPTIFRQFEQGESEKTRRVGGLGLGLSIANILINKHGGSIRAESDGQGLGSTFTVTLPTSSAAEVAGLPDSRGTEADAKRLHGVRILIVEDDPDSREVLQIFLEQNGALVVTAETARNAFTLLADQGSAIADILISDLAMPEEDGYSLVSRIRSLPEANGGKMPALALSAFVSAESRQKAFDAGFNRYLTKPFEPESIVTEILSLISLTET